MTIFEIINHPKFWDSGNDAQSNYFKLPCSWNNPIFITKKNGIIMRIIYHGEIRENNFVYQDLKSREWYFCDESGIEIIL